MHLEKLVRQFEARYAVRTSQLGRYVQQHPKLTIGAGIASQLGLGSILEYLNSK